MTRKTNSDSARVLTIDTRFAEVEKTMQEFNYEPHGLIEVLMTAQECFGYLSKDLLTYVAERLHIPLAKVYGVATFYDMFTLKEVGETHVMVCTGPVCSAAGAQEILHEACKLTGVEKPNQTSPDGHASVKAVSCLGLCDQAPAALVNDTAQVHVHIEEVPAMLRQELPPPKILVTGDPRILTAPIGRITATDLDAHRSEGAFLGLEKALREMTPEEVIQEVKDARLTGRGGAGFPTGAKWEFARKAPGPTRYVVCNFDESEPGTFKDRALMEGNPYRVLEGLIVNGYAIGAETGYIFIRGEYPTAASVVDEALHELYENDLLGDHILGTDYHFDIEVRRNAGAYICGEETALFEAIEGQRGHPRRKPPYPTVSGLFGRPTAINNVETLSVVPSLVLHGGEWFHQWGTPASVGLKLFCLSGHVNQPGVVEAPMGLTIRELVERFGSGFDGTPRAVLIGGAAGGFIHADHLDTPLTHEDLAPLDVPIGSGALMVFNDTVDLWQVLQGLAHFFVHEACGKCAPCRLGTKQIYTLLNKINLGAGSQRDLLQLEKLGKTVRGSCACGLGLTAANPVLTYMQHFDTALR